MSKIDLAAPNILPDVAEAGLRRNRAELAFLPAAMELVESPPHPLGRTVALTICLLVTVAIAWAALAKIDIVATAQGRLIPAGHSKKVQPFESGVLRAIHVQDGDTVKAGEVLIELDPTETGADRQRLEEQLIIARLQAARLEAALSGRLAMGEVEGASAALRSLHERLLQSELMEQDSRLAAVDGKMDERAAERAALAAEHDRHEAILPLLQERLSTLSRLNGQGSVARFEVIDARQAELTTRQELTASEKRIEQSDAAIAALEDERRHAVAQFRRQKLDELAQAENEIAQLTQELVKARERHGRQLIKAPVDGTVQELAVHTVGGVVTPAQLLLMLVPNDEPVLAEAWIENKDIGFVSSGQAAEVKIDAFPYTKYGLIDAEVAHVSDDAIPKDPQAPGVDAANRPMTVSAFAYKARLQLDRTKMNVDGRIVELVPGMTVTADIRTGERTVMEYLLTPFLRYGSEVMRER